MVRPEHPDEQLSILCPSFRGFLKAHLQHSGRNATVLLQAGSDILVAMDEMLAPLHDVSFLNFPVARVLMDDFDISQQG